MGSDVPLAIGDSVPLNGTLAPQLTKAYSGERGREGRIPLPDARAENISAAELIVELVKANPGEIILAPVGPQTNIATALALDPTIAEDVAGIVFMGGALGKGPAATRGNITPVAECNIYFDPIAADRVFKSGIDLSMVGLDVTNAETGLMLMREDLAGIDPDHSAAARLFLDICATYLDAPMFNVYSRFSENVGTVYRVGTSPRGPFRTPKDEYLGGRRWYAAKSAEHTEGGRTFFGWIHDKEEVRGKERWLWGGDFTAARRVTQDKNGDLQVALMPQIRDHFAEVLEEKEADISAVGTTRSALLFDPLPENAFLEFSFAFEETPAEYGIMFEEDDLGSGWRVTFDRRTSQIFLTREPRELDDFWADLTHRTGDGREVDGHHLASAMLPNAAGLERQLTVILEGELLELYVDDQVALSYRLKPRKASSLSAFVNDGEARVKTEMRGAAK